MEARALVKSVKSARAFAEALGCEIKGSYLCKDIIFVPKNKKNYNLSDDFLRVRVYARNNRQTKNTILVRKRTEFKGTGKIDRVVLKMEFDTEQTALTFIEANLNSEFRRGFEYSREGWEYHLGDRKIFVENIKGYGPSVEVEAGSEEELNALFKKMGATEIVKESVPEIMRKRLKF